MKLPINCVTHPEIKDSPKLLEVKYGRMFPELPALVCDFESAVAPEQRSLTSRDLQRGVALDLPSGEAVAREMGVEPLTDEECGLRATGWDAETPLWYYVLKEAEVRAGGERLGPVGGRIVAEVLLGLLDADSGSHRHVEPAWKPVLPVAEPDDFTMADLLVFAEAV